MEHDNEKLDAMLERLMRDEALESPSVNFTDKVMDKVYAIEASEVTVYKPLISRRIWLIIGLVLGALFTYILINGSTTENQWFNNFNRLNVDWSLVEGFDFQFSKTLSYAALLLALMVGVQVTVLKTYFDRRLSI